MTVNYFNISHLVYIWSVLFWVFYGTIAIFLLSGKYWGANISSINFMIYLQLFVLLSHFSNKIIKSLSFIFYIFFCGNIWCKNWTWLYLITCLIFQLSYFMFFYSLFFTCFLNLLITMSNKVQILQIFLLCITLCICSILTYAF